MKLSAFRFDLPDKHIAQLPAIPPEEARLMVVHRTSGKIEHKLFKDVVTFFGKGDTLVVNDSKVLSTKLYGNKEKTGAKVELTLLRALDSTQNLWDAVVEPARKIRVGNKIYFGNGELVAEVIDNTTSRGRTVKLLFDEDEAAFHMLLDEIGHMPLPKQIQGGTVGLHKQHYQTCFAKNTGSVVVPAAGRHFYPYLLRQLELQGTHIAPITLHIGLGDLKEIDMEDLVKFKPGSERFVVGKEAATQINTALDSKNKVCAVGTSVVRSVESSVTIANRIKPQGGWTNKFILPSYRYKIFDTLLTSFHLPCSPALVSVVAFGGYDLIMKAYETAIKENYNFFVYGDAMLIL